MKAFQHKSLGGFDVEVATRKVTVLGQPPQAVRTRYRIMVEVDPRALVNQLGPQAVRNKSGKTTLAFGAIRLSNLGGVEV